MTDPVQAWADFCRRVGALGEALPGEERAEGARHLARQVVMALQGHLEHGDPAHPSLHRYEEPWVQWGGPNPDNVYVRAAIDPGATYRLTSDVTGVAAAIVSLVEGDMHLGALGVYAERTLDDLEVGPGGELEVWISPDDHPGNWMPSDPAARQLLIRQYQVDWERDRVASFRLERTDTAGVPPPPPTGDDVAAALDRAATWVERSASFWAEYVDGARAASPHNGFGPPTTPPGGAPTIAYGAGWWELAPGEALVVTHDLPDADYWGWTIHTRHRMDSGDFAGRQTSLNRAQAHVDGDGRVRLVVAGEDPGTPNWIDTEGRAEGLLVYRYVGARTRPLPEGEVVPVADVRSALPADHPPVTPDERRARLAARRAAVLARYR
jgi:hypothetical protein